MFGCTYVYLDPHVFLRRYSTLSQTSLNRILCFPIITRIVVVIELFSALNSFVGQLKVKTYGNSIYIRVSGGDK